jgi:hypothetical protein
LCVLVAGVGLFVPGFYRDSLLSIPFERANDLAALVVGVPLLVVSLRLEAQGSVRGYFLWMGVVGWAIYFGAVDAFSLQFNPLFLAYVAILGLATYTLILGLGAADPSAIARTFRDDAPLRWIGGYLIVAALLTAMLWLSDIVPAIVAGSPPVAIAGRGIPVEPSHVLDLGLLLPVSFLAGILLIRRRPWGYLLAGVCLVLLVPLLTAVSLAPIFLTASGQPLAVGPVASFVIILVLDLGFTSRYLKSIHNPTGVRWYDLERRVKVAPRTRDSAPLLRPSSEASRTPRRYDNG